jgi:hypothetical protein
MTSAPAPSVTQTIKPHIRRGSKPYLFHIESSTRPGLFHITDAYRLTCTCEAGRNGRRCHHLHQALEAEKWYRRAELDAQQRRLAQASSVPFHETAGYRALAECFG